MDEHTHIDVIANSRSWRGRLAAADGSLCPECVARAEMALDTPNLADTLAQIAAYEVDMEYVEATAFPYWRIVITGRVTCGARLSTTVQQSVPRSTCLYRVTVPVAVPCTYIVEAADEQSAISLVRRSHERHLPQIAPKVVPDPDLVNADWDRADAIRVGSATDVPQREVPNG